MKSLAKLLVIAASCFVTNARTVQLNVHRVKRRCQKITVPMCRGALPYSSTEFPNSLDHYSQKSASRSLQTYENLVDSKCSKDLAFFICAYHLPVCMSSFSEPIRPCREVCEKVKQDCAATIQRLGWTQHSDTVRCQDLPSYETGVCVKQDSFVKNLDNKLSCKKQPRLRYRAYARRGYQYVLKLTVTSIAQNDSSGNMTSIGGNVTRILKRGRVPLKKGPTSVSIMKPTCLLASLKVNHDYIIAGHEDVAKGKLVLLKNGFVKPAKKKWYLRLKKWESRISRKSQTAAKRKKRPQAHGRR